MNFNVSEIQWGINSGVAKMKSIIIIIIMYLKSLTHSMHSRLPFGSFSLLINF